MDILRIDSDDGIYHIVASDVRAIAPHETDAAKCVVIGTLGGQVVRMTVSADPDEMAAMFESSYSAARVHRIN